MDITDTTWRGLPAWRIRGDRLEAIVMVTGGHLAALMDGDGVNPLWQPPWPSGDGRLADQGWWGIQPEGTLLSSIVGSNLCIDRFGAPHPGERRPLHGEAGAVRWQREGDGFTAWLPEARLRVRRRIVLDGNRADVIVAVAHDDLQPRAIEWCEHVTLGPPFLDLARCTAGVDAAWKGPWADQSDSSRPHIPPEGSVPVAEALRIPHPDAPPHGDIATARVVDGWFRVENPHLGHVLSARWNRDEFPWLCLWTQHRSRRDAPWWGRTRTRGLEISTKPFPEGLPPAERAEQWHGRPTTCTIPVGRWLERTISLRWERM